MGASDSVALQRNIFASINVYEFTKSKSEKPRSLLHERFVFKIGRF